MLLASQVSVLGCVQVLLRSSSAVLVPTQVYVELQVFTCALAQVSCACCNLHKSENGLVGSSSAARVFEASTSCLIELASSSKVTRLVLAPDITSLLRSRDHCRGCSSLDASLLPTVAGVPDQSDEVSLSTSALQEKLLSMMQACHPKVIAANQMHVLY
jgi:hypothetical protein